MAKVLVAAQDLAARPAPDRRRPGLEGLARRRGQSRPSSPTAPCPFPRPPKPTPARPRRAAKPEGRRRHRHPRRHRPGHRRGQGRLCRLGRARTHPGRRAHRRSQDRARRRQRLHGRLSGARHARHVHQGHGRDRGRRLHPARRPGRCAPDARNQLSAMSGHGRRPCKIRSSHRACRTSRFWPSTSRPAPATMNRPSSAPPPPWRSAPRDAEALALAKSEGELSPGAALLCRHRRPVGPRFGPAVSSNPPPSASIAAAHPKWWWSNETACLPRRLVWRS